MTHNLPEQHSIANKHPKWWKGPTLEKLNPGSIVWQLKRKEINQGDYTYRYKKMLKRLDEHGYDWGFLEGKTLLCWEPIGMFCHRNLLADFLEQKGFEVIRR